MQNEVSFLRHSGWFSPDDANETTLNIIGVGATGSWIGLTAARMGFHSFRIWDADLVESHNLPNQIYSANHINMKKVDAFEQVLKQFNPRIEIEKHDYFFETSKHKDLLEGPLVLTVDTMSARKDIYDSFSMNWNVEKVFETRLGFDYAELNILDNMNPVTTSQWVQNLKSDSEIEEGPCNLRVCSTLTSMISGFTVHKICDMLSSRRRNANFTFDRKTIINFNTSSNLQTYNIA